MCKNTYILLLIALPGDDSVNAMQQQAAKLLNLVVLPIVYSYDELLQSFVQKIAVNSIIGFVKYSFGCIAPSNKLSLDVFVICLLCKILSTVVSSIQVKSLGGMLP